MRLRAIAIRTSRLRADAAAEHPVQQPRKHATRVHLESRGLLPRLQHGSYPRSQSRVLRKEQGPSPVRITFGSVTLIRVLSLMQIDANTRGPFLVRRRERGSRGRKFVRSPESISLQLVFQSRYWNAQRSRRGHDAVLVLRKRSLDLLPFQLLDRGSQRLNSTRRVSGRGNLRGRFDGPRAHSRRDRSGDIFANGPRDLVSGISKNSFDDEFERGWRVHGIKSYPISG